MADEHPGVAQVRYSRQSVDELVLVSPSSSRERRARYPRRNNPSGL